MEDEYKHALEGVEGGEQVGHDNCVLIDEEETKCPSQSQQEEQSDGPQSPRPDGRGQESESK